MKTNLHFGIILLSFALVGCRTSSVSNNKNLVNSAILCSTPVDDSEWYKSLNKAPIFDDLGTLNFSIQTIDKSVQSYFNQGMTLAYGFNHAEAARSFYYATKLDPLCPMAYWGYAYVLGPNYNSGMAEENYAKAYKAIQNAMRLARNSSDQLEKDLIAALAIRYPQEPISDRSEIDSLYSVEMAKLFSKYPKHADVGGLYVESLLNLHPWNLWQEDGSPKPWTPQIMLVLEKLIRLHPNHPGIHHFYIHAIEASKTPEKGLRSARALDNGIVPGSGHLMHMPSHIYIRTGDYHKGSLANIAAIDADSFYITACRAQGAYPLIYHPHNEHFLAATATLEGKKEWAIMAAEQMSESISRDLMQNPSWGTLQHFYTIPYHIYIKFGSWDKIYEMEELDTFLVYPEIIKNYAFGMAHVATRKLDDAKKDLKTVRQLLNDPRLAEVKMGPNGVIAIAEIAELVLKGEILYAESKISEAIETFELAVSKEDNLAYIEPPDWFFSVRHHLGQVYLEQKMYNEAEILYKEDLERLPKNGWALSGLKQVYQETGNRGALQEADKALLDAWQYADVALTGSKINLE